MYICTSASACQHGCVHVGVFCSLHCRHRLCYAHTRAMPVALHLQQRQQIISWSPHAAAAAQHGTVTETQGALLFYKVLFGNVLLMCVTGHVGRNKLRMSLRLTPQWFTPSLSWLTKLGLAAPPLPHILTGLDSSWLRTNMHAMQNKREK